MRFVLVIWLLCVDFLVVDGFVSFGLREWCYYVSVDCRFFSSWVGYLFVSNSFWLFAVCFLFRCVCVFCLGFVDILFCLIRCCFLVCLFCLVFVFVGLCGFDCYLCFACV